jgi:glutamine synthetase
MKSLFSTVTVMLTGSSAIMAFTPIANQHKTQFFTTTTSPSSSSSTSLFAKGILESTTGQAQLDPAVHDRYANLPYPKEVILAEYVWVDAVGALRSKTRTLPASKGKSVETVPNWNFDGSSTGQAPGDDSEVILRPCRIFRDPFRPRNDGVDNILIMCDTYNSKDEAIPTNTRAIAMKAFEGHDDEEIWFGLEQEFTLFNLDQRTPLGWPESGMPNRPQGYVFFYLQCLFVYIFNILDVCECVFFALIQSTNSPSICC